MSELYHREELMMKNECFRTVVLEKTTESSLDGKEIKAITLQLNKKKNQI